MEEEKRELEERLANPPNLYMTEGKSYTLTPTSHITPHRTNTPTFKFVMTLNAP